MARAGLALVPPLLLLAALVAASARAEGDELSLLDALDDNVKKTTSAPRQPSGGDELNLEDAIGGNHDPMLPSDPKPKPPPDPRNPGTSGGFSDDDLRDTVPGREGHGDGGGTPRGEGADGEPQAMIPGIVSAVVVALAGAVSSFIAYQKKKLCFKENDHGEVDLENRPTTSAEPPVHQTLLER